MKLPICTRHCHRDSVSGCQQSLMVKVKTDQDCKGPFTAITVSMKITITIPILASTANVSILFIIV